MTDLTTITTPFGLLDTETQEALKAHGGPWEYYDFRAKWRTSTDPTWIDRNVYRVKPTPPKPREWWMRLNLHGQECGTDPVEGPSPPNWAPERTILVREVLE